jgi:hypothetical protein
MKGTMQRGSDRERDGMREREGGRRGVRGWGRERCDFLVSLHEKSGTDQVVALAHFYVGGQDLLTRYEPSPKGAKWEGEN